MKLFILAAPATGFLAGAVTVATSARAHQLAAMQMSNGKDGTMSPADGYLIALALFVMGLAYAYGAWRVLKTMKKGGD
jgi:hypothetical protein